MAHRIVIALTLLLATAMSQAAHAETPVQRGAYLVTTIMTCGNCHTPMGPDGPQMDKALSGGLSWDTPAFTVTAPNITPDRATGIGAWSDAEIAHLLRTGVRPNGVPLAPIMPIGFYGIISDDDMAAIIAYLRTVKPVRNQVPAPLYRIAVADAPFPGAERPMADRGGSDPVRRGFYLATIGHCMECHTPVVDGRPDFADRLGAGGQRFPGPWGVSVSRNLTSDPVAGLGRWSDAEIKRAITQGIARDGSRLKPPMGFAYYAHMTNGDLDALVAWLRTLPPRQ